MNLWKYIFTLKKNNKEQGFTIPLVLGIGLFMLLAGITAIKMGSTSETNSKLQKKSSQALAAAETGLARIQSILDEKRELAIYPDCVSRSGDVCSDGGTVASWGNPGAITTSTTTTSCGTTTTDTSSALISALAQSLEWQDISSDPNDGQFRLVSYIYTPNANANEPPGTGELTVEGRTAQDAADAVKADNKAYNTGVARIKAEIPVNENIFINTSSVPGLWIKYQNSTNMANDKVNGDILVEGCLVPGGIDSANLSDPTTQTISSSTDAMPDTPELTTLLNGGSTTLNYLIGDGIASADNTPANDPAITDPFASSSYPRSGDDAAPDGYYHYLIPSLIKNGNTDIEIAAGAKVIFYLQGNLDMGGNTSINMQSNGNTPANLQIYGNTVVANGTGLNGTNYKYGGTSATTTMYFNGTPEVKALIHAPSAAGGVAGGGNTEGSFKGTLWLNDWNPQSNNSKVKVDAVGQLSDLISSSSTQTIEPQMTVTSSWAREEVPQ
jgi:hypothetical protein